MDSLGVNRLLRAMYTDPNTHGLPLLNLELPELLSLSLKVLWQKYTGKKASTGRKGVGKTIKWSKNGERRIFTSFTWLNRIKMH